jgi:hypothetical protein
MDRTIPEAFSHHVPAWLVRGCRWLTRGYRWVWSSLFNILLSLIATWLFTSLESKFNTFPITALAQYWYVTAVCFLFLVLLTGLAWSIGNQSITKSPDELKRQYLTKWISDTQNLIIEGLPQVPSLVPPPGSVNYC